MTRSISVLLVDDDADWVSITGELIEQTDPSMAVTTATGVAEAGDVLGRQRIDCIVCDYRMPDVDGLEFLHAVRETHPKLPFVMITGSGSEKIASEAISAKVTDYFVKEQRIDQSTMLATRIHNAVDRDRAERALAVSEQRFSALFDSVPDPVVLVDGRDRIVRAVNPAFEATFDCDSPDVVGGPLASSVVEVRPGEPDEDVRGSPEPVVLDGPGDGSVVVREVRCDTDAGVRDFLYRGFPIEIDGTVEEYAIYTDITDRKERERAIARERDLEAELRDLVLTAQSRSDVEAAFCDLAAADHAFAWIGGFDPTGRLSIRAQAGEDDGYLDALGERAEAADCDAPAVQALRTSTPQSGTDEAASGSVYHVLAAPITLHGVPYGVLGVYDGPLPRGEGDGTDSESDDTTGHGPSDTTGHEPGVDPALDAVVDLGETLGVAIAAIERRAALSANHVVEADVRVEMDDHPLVTLADCLECEIGVTGHVTGEERCQYFVEIEAVDAAAFQDRTASFGALDTVQVLTTEPRLRVQFAAPPIFTTTLVEHGGIVRSMTVRGGTVRATVAFPSLVDVPDVLEELQDSVPGLTVAAYREREYPWGWQSPSVLPGDLTDRQHEAVTAAYHGGYFERPRHQSAEELAEALGIARTTFMHHLRVAERKVIEALLDGESSG